MRRIIGILVISLALAALSGCGFQMRGDWQLPVAMQHTVMSGGSQALYTHLQREFRSASAKLSRSQGNTKGAHLFILQNQMSKRVLSVDSRGKVAEYELYYLLRFKLLDSDGNPIAPEQQINMTRDYPFAATDVIGAGQEERLQRDEMYREMARQLMRRIQAQG